MKAIVFREDSQWAVEEVPNPEPAAGEVLLKVLRTGVCGTDEHLLHGGFIAKLPLVPGHEILGEIVALGAGVDQRALGEVVAVDNTIHCGDCARCLAGQALFCENFVSLGCNAAGGFAEFVVVRASKTHSADGLDTTTAGLAEPTACALHGVDLLDVRLGSRVLIFGSGPTGMIMAQLLKAAGASQVVMAAPTASKLALAERLGVDATVQLDRGAPADSQAALADLAPGGYDIVVEATGSTEVLELGLEVIATGGTLLVYGVAAESAVAKVRPYEIFSRELTIRGSFAQAHTLGRAMAVLRSGVVKTDGIVTDVVGFADFARAIENLHDSNQVKTVFEPHH